jgi:hypothetical protein
MYRYMLGAQVGATDTMVVVVVAIHINEQSATISSFLSILVLRDLEPLDLVALPQKQ